MPLRLTPVPAVVLDPAPRELELRPEIYALSFRI
jgi:hypothetical protein